jgi:hypothetical protein
MGRGGRALLSGSGWQALRFGVECSERPLCLVQANRVVNAVRSRGVVGTVEEG